MLSFYLLFATGLPARGTLRLKLICESRESPRSFEIGGANDLTPSKGITNQKQLMIIHIQTLFRDAMWIYVDSSNVNFPIGDAREQTLVILPNIVY